VRYYFGLGLGHENVAFCYQFFTQFLIIRNHAVVNDRDSAGAIAMRMSVYLRGNAVGSPAGMGNPRHPFQKRRFLHQGFPPDDVLIQAYGTAVHRQTAGIIAAIFKPFQAIQKY
jgi:hypothetical protein